MPLADRALLMKILQGLYKRITSGIGDSLEADRAGGLR